MSVHRKAEKIANNNQENLPHRITLRLYREVPCDWLDTGHRVLSWISLERGNNLVEVKQRISKQWGGVATAENKFDSQQ